MFRILNLPLNLFSHLVSFVNTATTRPVLCASVLPVTTDIHNSSFFVRNKCYRWRLAESTGNTQQFPVLVVKESFSWKCVWAFHNCLLLLNYSVVAVTRSQILCFWRVILNSEVRNAHQKYTEIFCDVRSCWIFYQGTCLDVEKVDLSQVTKEWGIFYVIMTSRWCYLRRYLCLEKKCNISRNNSSEDSSILG